MNNIKMIINTISRINMLSSRSIRLGMSDVLSEDIETFCPQFGSEILYDTF